eukprot:CAMPEP_0177794602 /NCGR_PEP_ID=MMETSP0491_2-20121128/25740_1 /TAXON_ID=63592 /ORGANISM="Tetraselmis chuii, Strain PLY429" /LENGTH=60 /DNA_ID=CAMNT_0019317283 /DNA_START=175 /DNA_END=357 /DNA_ORIENTATION=-
MALRPEMSWCPVAHHIARYEVHSRPRASKPLQTDPWIEGVRLRIHLRRHALHQRHRHAAP